MTYVPLCTKDSEGFTVLHVAVKNNCPVEVAQGLIRKGIKANTVSIVVKWLTRLLDSVLD